MENISIVIAPGTPAAKRAQARISQLVSSLGFATVKAVIRRGKVVSVTVEESFQTDEGS